ncbi:MAG: hypothetical protein IPM54_25995 [Polyangiaceae bacterium]|nr:hypothetical protein [Polyangiaceae bacterium]
MNCADAKAPCKRDTESATFAISDELHAQFVRVVEQTCKAAADEKPNTSFIGQQAGVRPIRILPPTGIAIEQFKRMVADALRSGKPVPAPTTPDPGPRAVDHPAAQFVGGAGAGVPLSFLPLGSLVADVGMESGVLPRGTPWARLGKSVGEGVGGIAQIGVGCVGIAGGGGLTATGGGAPAGVVIVVGSAGLVANGLLSCVVSVQHGADALSDILSRADDSQPATAAASTPPPSPAPATRPPQAPPAKAPPAPWRNRCKRHRRRPRRRPRRARGERPSQRRRPRRAHQARGRRRGRRENRPPRTTEAATTLRERRRGNRDFPTIGLLTTGYLKCTASTPRSKASISTRPRTSRV